MERYILLYNTEVNNQSLGYEWIEKLKKEMKNDITIESYSLIGNEQFKGASVWVKEDKWIDVWKIVEEYCLLGSNCGECNMCDERLELIKHGYRQLNDRIINQQCIYK